MSSSSKTFAALLVRHSLIKAVMLHRFDLSLNSDSTCITVGRALNFIKPSSSFSI